MYMYIQHRGRAPSLHDSPPTLRPQEVHIGTSYGYKTKCVATRGGGSAAHKVMGEAAEMWSRFESSFRYNVIHGYSWCFLSIWMGCPSKWLVWIMMS